MGDCGGTTRHKGYKDHRCIWCSENIPRGEMFAHYKGSWNGEWQNWRMHEDCYDVSTRTDDFSEGFEPYVYKRGSAEQR